ncbi:MAG: FG-GAP-like repeat-containing protein, partial [Gemmatimonadaceae bacterium]
LFITNGIYRRPNDLDYINFVGNDAVQAALANGVSGDNLALLQRMPRIPLANYAFRNDSAYRFTNMAESWGLAQPGFSNGAVYVDLNNSGALDLVVNNVAAPASIYRSHARDQLKNSYLTVTLHGDDKNTAGIGARVMVTAGGVTQTAEQMPTRGFLSSVDARLHFGFGAATRADSLVVIWPDHRMHTIKGVALNSSLKLEQRDANERWTAPRVNRVATLFTDASKSMGVSIAHQENDFLDYDREPLMPLRLSTEGPALASGDVNGDGLDDLYVGGAKWQSGTLLLQQRDGTFRKGIESPFMADSLAEDVDATFFDADGDGDLDLYVVSAGNEFWGDADALADRLYLNDGKEKFTRSVDALPKFFENGSCVVAGDFDGDGDLDLFVGTRVVARQYGVTPRSHLLRNDGKGHFADVTESLGAQLGAAGMVSSAAWLDYDGDGRLDLIVAGEWMPVRVFHQEGGHFVDRTREAGLGGSEGWWNSVTVADVNGDGRNDLILGNIGLNAYVHASASEPARLYVGDFFQTGSLKQILTFYKHGVSYPVVGRDELVRLMPALRSRYTSYEAFGAARVEDIFPPAELAKATVREAHTFASTVAMGTGKGFTLRALPAEAQFFPVRDVLARDFDGDGKVDLLIGGNFYGVTPIYGRYDAGYSLFLRGAGDGTFTPIDMTRSGISIDGEVRKLRTVRWGQGALSVAVARNNDTLLLLRQLQARRDAP